MRILLVGEYSGLHNNLKDGLIKLGHEVVLASSGDGFKSLHTDINFQSGKSSRLLRYLDSTRRYATYLPKMTGFDVVQFINPYIFSLKFGINQGIIKYLVRNNKKSFLVGAGDDSVVWEYWQQSPRVPLKYLWINGQKKDCVAQGLNASEWESKDLKVFNRYLAERVNGIIPIMYEYEQPYLNFPNVSKAIGIPINVDKINYQENIVRDKLCVFHGLNRYYAKGTNYVEEAFKILREKYPDQLELVIDGRMPYHEYIKIVERSNVVIDQVFSYSLAVNALASMAQGKIVLGGNEEAGNTALRYNMPNPALNVEPDPLQIVTQVEQVMQRQNEITSWGRKSREFVEANHHYIDIAKKYIEIWEQH